MIVLCLLDCVDADMSMLVSAPLIYISRHVVLLCRRCERERRVEKGM
jgi:hypothetical protein